MNALGKLALAGFVSALLLASLGAGTAGARTFDFNFFKATYHDPFDPTPPQPYENGRKDLTNQAGIHADSVTEFTFDLGEFESVHDVQVDLPAGFYGNPEALPYCTIQFLTEHGGICNPSAQVGTFRFYTFEIPVYNMAATTNQTAVLAVEAFGSLLRFVVSARTDGDYGLQVNIRNINQGLPVEGTEMVLWGVPASETNDPLRWEDQLGNGGKSANIPVKPFLSAPARCDQPITTKIYADSWETRGRRNPDGTIDLSDPNWIRSEETLPPLNGCDQLEFAPTLDARPTTNVADAPSGLDVDLHLPQNVDPEGLATAQLKTTHVTFPEGLTLNPAGSNGLGSCGPKEIGLTTPVGAEPHFSRTPETCPDSSRIGTVEIDTPVFSDPLRGGIYVMTPYDNPFGSLLGIYAVAEGRGLKIALPGKVVADPVTGRLTSIFDENPQLPFEHFYLKIDGGPFGIMRTPQTCGTYNTDSVMTSWATPDVPTVSDRDEYALVQSPAAGCPTSKAQLPNAPRFEAGTTSVTAGAYAPFVLKLSRPDGSQELSGLDATLPRGLLAKLADVPYCSEALLAAAAAKTGKAEQANASCPAASRVGGVTVGAGAGPRPFFAPGTAYLAGPYKGAPLSLAVVTPAVAGPYDLGTVVVRNALYLDPITTQVHAVSDPFPRILQGIPLDLRSIELRLDRPEFTKNPTSCDPLAISGAAATLLGQTAPFSNRFQTAECGRLKFGPRLALRLKGETNRTGNPALTAVLNAPPGEANIAETTVVLPKTQFIDNAHLNNPCTRVQFNADACPQKSILGTARAFTPLLDEPLEGPVYFRSNGGERNLPDMVVDLRGQIDVTLVGFIDSIKAGKDSSRVRTRFATVPDAPVTKFVLKLFGGKKGLLENSVDLCREGAGKATVLMQAHNSKIREFAAPLRADCAAGSTKRKGR
jgi:hypothetical protein